MARTVPQGIAPPAKSLEDVTRKYKSSVEHWVELSTITPMFGGSTNPKQADSRNPTAFLVVPRETRFLITLDCPDAPDWAEAAMTVLSFGLMKLGLGGMTNSGYGRFDIAPWKEAA